MKKRIILESVAGDRKKFAKACSATELTKQYRQALNIGDFDTLKILDAELYDRGYIFHIAPLDTILRPSAELFGDELVCFVIDAKGDIDKIFERAEDLHNKTGTLPASTVLLCYTIATVIGETILAQKLANFIKRCHTYDQLIKGYLQLCSTTADIYKRLAKLTETAEAYRSW